MKLPSDLNRTLPAVERVEQTVSTAPSQLPETLERISPKTETSATSFPSAALSIARQLLIGVALSPLSGSAQPIAFPLWRRYEFASSAASSQANVDPALVEHMRQIFRRGASEFFEDGMDSNFAKELLLSIMEHGNPAIDAIAEYLFSSTANSDVGSEALRRLTDVEDRRSFASRWALLRRSLKHRSSRIRDGAILGFAYLDDHRALELLRSAELEEIVPELRQLIRKVIEQLGATDGETAAQG